MSQPHYPSQDSAVLRLILILLLGVSLTLSYQPKIAQAQWNDNGSNLTTSDNVGIGTTSPGGKLDINGVTVVHNGYRTHVVSGLNGPNNSTDSNRYEIGRMGVNQVHWGEYGVITIELFQTYYDAGAYQKWYVKAGFGDYSGSATLVEKYGNNQYAKVTLGTPVLTGNSSGGYPNQYIPIYVEASNYTIWRVKITHNWPMTDNMVPEKSEFKFFEPFAQTLLTGQVISVPDVSTISDNLTITGNVGIGTMEPTKKLDVRGSVGIGGGVTYGNGLTITSTNTAAANHTTTFQGPASGTNDVVWFDLNRAGGAYGSFDISGAGATLVHFPMASLTAPGWINTPGDFYFNGGGSIGIGTSTPDSTKKLHIAGDVRIDGNIAAKYQDVAEWVTSPKAMPAGTVVILHPEQTNQVLPSVKAYDTRVAGVVSEMPGLLLGEAGEGKVKVATTGRVKVKVDATKKSIQVGDLLVTSDKEGVAMKSEPLDLGGVPIHRPGTLIGKALEPLSEGEGEILVLLSLQ
jgi:hypothetical protein